MSENHTATPDRAIVHVETMPVRWGDMDAIGHVNNTVYFRFMEQARIGWLQARGYLPDPGAQSTGPVIVNAACTFFKPITYPATVEIRVSHGKPGRSSVETYYELLVNGERYAEGSAKMVWIDFAAERSIPLPPDLL